MQVSSSLRDPKIEKRGFPGVEKMTGVRGERGDKLTEGGGEKRTARVQCGLGGTEGNIRTCGPVRSEGEEYGWGNLEKWVYGFVCGARGFEGKVSRQKV